MGPTRPPTSTPSTAPEGLPATTGPPATTSAACSALVLDHKGNPAVLSPPAQRRYVIEFFAYETIGIPLETALEMGIVRRLPDGTYLVPEGSTIGPMPS
jgi:hypothetical protein